MSNEQSSPQEHITAFWNEVAADYDARPGNVAARGTPEYAAWVELLRSLLPTAPSDVLDVGTGTGFVALISAELGHRVTGIDLSERMLDAGRRQAADRGLEATFLAGDAVEPPFASSSFDVVTNRYLLWTLRDLPTAFVNWKRVLRPHGRLIAVYGTGPTTPPPGPAREFFERYYTQDVQAAIPDIQAMDHDLLKEVAAHAGFSSFEFADLPTVRDAAGEGRDNSGPFVLTASRK